MKDRQTHEENLAGIERRLLGYGRQEAIRLFRLVLWRLSMKMGGLIKRLVDIIVSLGALVTLSPLFIVVSAIIKLTDGGAVFFWQTRVGRWGKTFRFPKFRSMVTNAEVLKNHLHGQNAHGESGVTFKMKHDPRITAIGRIIRKTSIDELPQLWCVLKGEMSLVGPRPALVQEVARYTLEDRARLEVTPGLTCIWQVSGRSDIAFPQQVCMDVDYIEHQNILLDFKLLLQTIPAVITGRGAY